MGILSRILRGQNRQMKPQSQTVTALVAYPLSQAYVDKLAKTVASDIAFINLQQLKAKGLKGLVTQLWQISGQLLIPLEDPTSYALLPIFQVLSLFTRAKTIGVINGELRLTKLSRLQSILAGFKLVFASLANLIAILRIKRSLRHISPTLTYPKIPAKGDILFINANLWFGIKAGGSVGHIAGVCNAFAKQGYRVTYAAVEPNQCLDTAVDYLHLKPLSTYGMPYEANLYRFHWQVLKQLTTWLKQHQPVFIYQRLSLGNMVGVTLSQQFNLPAVIEYNGSETWIAKHWGKGLKFQQLAEQVETACLSQANYVVTISDPLAQELIAKQIPADRITTYPNGIDPKRFDDSHYDNESRQNLRAQLAIPENAIICTFVGTFGLWHGVDVLANALATLANDEPDWFAEHQVYCVFVGDGVQLPAMKATISASAAAPYCRFVGLVPQLQAPIYLAISDILLSPHKPNDNNSRFFGSPTKVFEYMAMGKAIIASDLEQIGEVLRPAIFAKDLPPQGTIDPKHALLCEPGNPADVIVALKWLVANPEWREKLGAAAKQKVLANYTWDHHVAQILKPMVMAA